MFFIINIFGSSSFSLSTVYHHCHHLRFIIIVIIYGLPSLSSSTVYHHCHHLRFIIIVIIYGLSSLSSSTVYYHCHHLHIIIIFGWSTLSSSTVYHRRHHLLFIITVTVNLFIVLRLQFIIVGIIQCLSSSLTSMVYLHRCHPQFIIIAIIYCFFHHRHYLHFFTCLLREVCFTKLTYFRRDCRQIHAEIVMPRKTTKPSRCITFHHAYIKYHINIKDKTKICMKCKAKRM